jgi:hypothetical protein
MTELIKKDCWRRLGDNIFRLRGIAVGISILEFVKI